jgi:hypothetical protein
MSRLTASPLFLFALLPQVFKESGHGAPHVETQEEVRQPGSQLLLQCRHPCIALSSSCQVCKCTQLQHPCSIRDNPSRCCSQGLAGKTFALGARTICGQAVMYTVQGVRNGSHDAHVTVFYGDPKEHSKY